MFLLVEGKVVMKKVLNITICLIGIALLYIGAVWNEKFIEHQFLEFDQIVSESGDNITFNLPEFDNQIIFNIYANEFFVGNRYDCLPVPLEVTRDQYEMKQKGNCILCYNNITNQKFILEAKKNKIYFKDANSNKLLYDLNKEYTNGFFIFGMGLRNKYILYRSSDIALGEYSLYDYQKKENLYVGIKNVQIDAEKYCAEGYIDKHKFQIFENEEGVYLVLDSEKYILDNSQHINIPVYEGKYARELRLLFNECMVNIVPEGIKPNFITYAKPFYRDVAYIAMVCEQTGNVSQIENWIENITEMYDLQRGSDIKEPDNLGELLYMQSLVSHPNKELIENIINEAYARRDEDGMLEGIMDGEDHPNYVVGWLKFGMESLGLDSTDWEIQLDKDDYYIDLLWFYDDEKLKEYRMDHEYYPASLWPYLDYARANFYNYDLTKYYEKNKNSYMSYEPGNWGGWNDISTSLDYVKSSTPHAWAAAEMYFYYLQYE